MASRTRPKTRKRRAFGKTWWGQAWVEALEDSARLDANRLPRGRSYARWGHVGEMKVDPGMVSAPVQGSRSQPYRVQVRVRPFTDNEWTRFLDVIASRAAHAAALIDGELSPELVDDAAAAGLELLPAAGEVGPRCSCPDWADPCKHSAALCYLIADLLDADPFGLLLLRGRTREEVVADLRGRRRVAGGVANTPDRARKVHPAGRSIDEGMVAREAFARQNLEPPAIAIPSLSSLPARPAPLPGDPPADSGLRRDDLIELASDAARRAWELCAGEGDGALGLSSDIDLARRASIHLDTPILAAMAKSARVPVRRLTTWARAWQLGGEAAIATLDERWSPSGEQLAPAVALLGAMGQVRTRDNYVTCAEAGLQLRLGTDGQWYRYEREGKQWALTGIEYRIATA